MKSEKEIKAKLVGIEMDLSMYENFLKKEEIELKHIQEVYDDLLYNEKFLRTTTLPIVLNTYNKTRKQIETICKIITERKKEIQRLKEDIIKIKENKEKAIEELDNAKNNILFFKKAI